MRIGDFPPISDSPYVLPPSPKSNLKAQLMVLQSELARHPSSSVQLPQIKENIEKQTALLSHAEVTVLVYKLLNTVTAYQVACLDKNAPRTRETLFNAILLQCDQIVTLLSTI
jgi:hypothetical protein